MSKKLVEFVLFPNANSLDITGPLEVFSVASDLLSESNENGGYRSVFTAEKTGAVTLESGLTVTAEKVLTSADKTDYLIIPGGSRPDIFVQYETRLRYIADRLPNTKRIVSICTGAAILAKLGVLNGKTCTTHWRHADLLAKEYPQIKVNKNAIYIEDGNVFTSAGVTAGIDLALALVEKDYGSELAIETARNLVLYLQRPGNQSQFSTPILLQQKAGDRFKKLYTWLQENLDNPTLKVEHLANVMAMSTRNFSRSFKQQTGFSPAKYLESTRLEKARELLSYSNEPIKTIALSCGFQQEERLRRLFIKTLGITPTQYRYHFKARQK